jgi:hypothetical protein
MLDDDAGHWPIRPAGSFTAVRRHIDAAGAADEIPDAGRRDRSRTRWPPANGGRRQPGQRPGHVHSDAAPSGLVLAAGGNDRISPGGYAATVELYNPATGTWAFARRLRTACRGARRTSEHPSSSGLVRIPGGVRTGRRGEPGYPLPGETTLILASVYAGHTHRLSPWLIFAVAAAGAIIGDNIGYWIGDKGGYRLLGPTVLRYGSTSAISGSPGTYSTGTARRSCPLAGWSPSSGLTRRFSPGEPDALAPVLCRQRSRRSSKGRNLYACGIPGRDHIGARFGHAQPGDRPHRRRGHPGSRDTRAAPDRWISSSSRTKPTLVRSPDDIGSVGMATAPERIREPGHR